MDTTKSPHGVYKNPRLMHVCTTIVGSTVHLQTKDGHVWEGIFNTFSEEFTVCLQLAVPIDPKLDSKDSLYQALRGGLQAKQKVFFDLKDIVRIAVVDVDLNYATKELDKITTDADISGFNSSKLGETRELESWQDDEGDDANDDSLLSLDEAGAANKNGSQNNSRTGWDPAEMFRYNEKVHKVSTTYDEELHDYTIALPKHNKNDRDWRKKQERAAAIAREIESNPQSQGRLAKEDGSDDEEEKFSAVVRPTTNQPQQTTQTQSEQSQPSPQSQLSNQHQSSQSQQPPTIQQNQHMPQHHHQQQQQLHHQHHQQHPHQHLHHQQQPQHQHLNQQSQHQRQLPTRNINNGTHNKNFRNPRYDRRLDSLKNFGKALTLAPPLRPPQGPINQMHGSPVNSQNQSSSPQQSHQQKQTKPLTLGSQNQQSQPQQPQAQPQMQPQTPAQTQTQTQNQAQNQAQNQSQLPSIKQTQATPTPASSSTTTATNPTVDTSVTSERSDTGSSLSSSQTKDQSEIARKSKLNPNAKEFVYKPRSPAIQATQTNGANPANTSGTIDPNNSSPMSQATHGPYYQQVPIFPHGLSPHQQPHHATQFMSNHPHMHAFHQSQIHYMPTPMAPHFAPQQMSPRYIRGNFQNYQHRGNEHMNNVRTAYSQASMVAPTSVAGQQQYVPPQSGAPPHPMSAYASPQQMIYSPAQSVYSMVPPSGFSQHMPHVPNPPPYDGNAVYMSPSQNYVVNPQQ